MVRVRLIRKKLQQLSLVVPCFVLLLTASPRVFAQCEQPGVAHTAASAVITAERSDVVALVAAVRSSWGADLRVLRRLMGLDNMNGTFMAKLNWFWAEWYQALRDMTAQLSSGTLNQTQQLSSFNDASNELATALEMQKEKVKAKSRYQPTAQACRFDTAATPLGTSRAIGKALTSGYALDFLKIGNNEKLSIASAGDSGVRAARWKIYQTKFCDPNAENSKNSGCAPGSNVATANMDVLPGKTLFSKETIDLSDANPDTREAVNQMLFNITGYVAPDPLIVTALPSPTGRQQMQVNREYIAQMDAVGALAYSVVGDRAPGQPAPDIQAMRQRMGVMDASATPSTREIRESVVEQLWDPEYYKELYDNPSTIAQKELYLKAYSLVMLYDMIAKQEKISNVYAIETANMLNKLSGSRHSVSRSNPSKSN